MNTRIKEVRTNAHLTQEAFAAALGLTRNFIAQIEIGAKNASDRTIRDICVKFGVNETWLRTGAGEMHGDKSHEEELGAAVAKLMANRPDSFKAAVVAALLRFDPDGPEWDVLEQIYNQIAEEWEKEKAGE